MSSISKGETGNIDTSQILMQINIIREEVKMKCDKIDGDKLKIEMRNYTDAETAKI